ncbi:MAG: adenylate cyclase [Rhodospirillales bacterium]|nr:adenylate cyclase [Rhodospirillales bacterium]
MPTIPRDASPQDLEFARVLRGEILRSERQRVLSLAVILTVLLLTLVGIRTFGTDFASPVFRERVQPATVFLVFVPFIVYELIVAGAVTYLLRHNRDIFILARYGNAALETSLPTVLLLLQIHAMGAVTALGFLSPLLYFLFIILSTLRLDFKLSAFTGAVAAIEIFVMAWLYLPLFWSVEDPTLTISYHLSRSAVLLVGGILAGLVGARLRRQFESALGAVVARDRVTNLFGQHVSPQVVERLLATGTENASETRQVCVLFFDIRGFTAAAQSRTPDEVVGRLDAAFAILVEIVERHQGIVNKFLGDGFLAMFGAPFDDPDAARHAVAAAREMLAAIEADNRGHNWPIRIGIGVHIGDAVTGNIGSPRRKEYTVIGDTVNLASRLEALNKEVGSQILISDAVHQACGDDGGGVALGPVAIRGYDAPVPVWRLA